MKTKSLLKIFGATLAVCAVSGAIVCVDTALTADASAPADAVFEMEQKASVRLGVNADDAGIRFRVVMNETMKNYIVNNDNVTCGFLIFQQKDLVSTSGTITDNYHENINVKVDIPCNESLIYQDGENYYANGALTQIKVTENFDRELTCVAYTYDGTNYEYADLNPEFSRSVYDVSSAAYIHEPTKRERLTATYSVLGDTAPVLIRSYDDLAAISAEVTEKGTTFANVKFELGTNITLPDDYVALPSEFAGTIDFGDYSVIAAKNQKIAVVNSSVTNARYVEVVDGTPYLISLQAEDYSDKYQNNLEVKQAFSAENDIAALSSKVTGTYSGNATMFTLYGSDLATYKEVLNLSWTDEQLQGLKQFGYQSITFNFMVYNSNLSGEAANSNIQNFMFLGQKYQYSDGKLQSYLSSDALLWNHWYNLSLSIDEVAKKITDKSLTLIENITKSSGLTPVFYFGEVTLSTEAVPEIPSVLSVWSVESNSAQLEVYQAVTTNSDTGIITPGGPGIDPKIGVSQVYTDESGVSYNESSVAHDNNKTTNYIFMKLQYTIDQLEFLQAKGYTSLKTTMRVTKTSGATPVTFSSDCFGTYEFTSTDINTTRVTLTAKIADLIAVMKTIDQTKGNYLFVGTIERGAGSSVGIAFCFTDIVLTKE